MGDEKKETRRLSDGDFWDMAALDALQGLCGDPNMAGPIPQTAALFADQLLAERRKRREGGAT